MEDEYHFLCICPKYKAQRQEMEKTLLLYTPNTISTIYIYSNTISIINIYNNTISTINKIINK